MNEIDDYKKEKEAKKETSFMKNQHQKKEIFKNQQEGQQQQ
ncbi:hypothetical protein [Polaribacter sp. R77954]